MGHKKPSTVTDLRHELNIKCKVVTPEMATEWLRRNKCNRPVRRMTVNFYARQMVERKWHLTGEAIKFDTEGNLLDGQHRLLACVAAGVPFKCAIVQGAHHDIFAVIDTGEKRSGADALDIAGYKNALTLSGAGKLMGLFLGGTATGIGQIRSGKQGRMSNEELLALVREHPGLVRSVNQYKDRIHKLMSPSLGCCLQYLCSRKDEDLAELFFDAVCDGIDLKATDPAYCLRERLIALKSDPKSRPELGHVAALTIKAWNLARKGLPCRNLKFTASGAHPETFPQVQ